MRRDPAGGRAVTLRIKPVRKPNGRTYWYPRLPGGKLGPRLPDLPHDHPDFLDAYTAAIRAAPGPVAGRHGPGSIARAIEAYQDSPAFRAHLKPATQGNRRRILGHIATRWGAANLADLARRHVEADLAPLDPHPANSRLKAWRGFLAWAVDAGAIGADPSAGIGRKRTARSPGHLPWTPAEVEAFRARWPIGTAERLAFELVHWTGARISDAVRLGPGMVDRAGWLSYAQEKTGGAVAVPLRRSLPRFARQWQGDLDALHAAIDAAPRHLTWMVTAQGASRSVKAASQWFAAAARAAGVPKSAHGLRKLRGQLIAEAGGTTHQAAAWLGHESLSEVARYSRGADRRRVLEGDETGTNLETARDPAGNSVRNGQ